MQNEFLAAEMRKKVLQRKRQQQQQQHDQSYEISAATHGSTNLKISTLKK